MTGLGTQRSQRRQHLINSSIAELRHSYFIISKHYLLITSKRLTELEHLQFRTDTDCQLQTSSDKQHHHDEIYSLGKPTIISQWYILMSQPYFTCCYQATTHMTGNDWFSEHYEEKLTKDNFSVFFVFQQWLPLNAVSKYSLYHNRDQCECSESWWAYSESWVRVCFDFYTSRKVVLFGQVGWKQQHHLADCAGLYTNDVDLT